MTSSADFPTSNIAKRVFISYAREDKDFLDDVRAGISALHHEVWLDSNLDGGQAWWDVILDQIRRCDAMILVVSPDLVDSEAASRERLYARQLGKRLIPLIVRKVSNDLLPPDIATLQFIDYTNPRPLTGAQLANALYSVPSAAALPDPLPEPPAVPVSYLGDMANVLRRPVLTADEQFSIAAKLSASLRRPREHDAAWELLQMLGDRRDLYHQTAKEIDRIRQDDATHLAEDGSPTGKAAPGRSQSDQREHMQSGSRGHGSGEYQSGNGQRSRDALSAGTAEPQVQTVGYEASRPEGETVHRAVPPSMYPDQAPRQQQTQQPIDLRQSVQEPIDWRHAQQQPQLPPLNAQTPPANWNTPTWQQPATLPPPPPRWALSVISLILFIPVGAFAIYFSSQVAARWTARNFAGAVDASKKAQVWGWIGIGVGAFWNLYLLSYSAMYGL